MWPEGQTTNTYSYTDELYGLYQGDLNQPNSLGDDYARVNSPDDTRFLLRSVEDLYEKVAHLTIEIEELRLIKEEYEILITKLKAAMEQCTTISEEDIADILGFGL